MEVNGYTIEPGADLEGADLSPIIDLVYGHLAGALQVASLSAAESFADYCERLETIISCNTWNEVRQALGPEDFEEEFGDYLAECWFDENPDEETERPGSWLPSWDPRDYTSGDWLLEVARIDDPAKCDVPVAILDVGFHSSGPLSGDFVQWTYGRGDITTDRLDEIRKVVAANGWNLTERQDLFDRIQQTYH